jgi:hypothetical protein
MFGNGLGGSETIENARKCSKMGGMTKKMAQNGSGACRAA